MSKVAIMRGGRLSKRNAPCRAPPTSNTSPTHASELALVCAIVLLSVAAVSFRAMLSQRERVLSDERASLAIPPILAAALLLSILIVTLACVDGQADMASR